MKYKLLIALLTLACAGYSQAYIVDDRDSTRYPVFQIENHLWFKSNLQFKSPTSWCQEQPASAACKSGNFYYATDLINVCPTGWRVPSWAEYKKAIKVIEKQSSFSADSVTYDESMMPYKKYKILAERVVGITLLGDTSFFDMAANGWIEGDKWDPQQETTMWVVEDISNSPQPHAHIRNGEIVKHAHEHNVIDKPKKVRRFSVRCVSDAR